MIPMYDNYEKQNIEPGHPTVYILIVFMIIVALFAIYVFAKNYHINKLKKDNKN